MSWYKLLAFSMALVFALLPAGGAMAQGAEPGAPPAEGAAPEASLAAMGTAFTYQGQLKKDGAPVNGTCDFRFSLWDVATGGAQLRSAPDKTGVTVSAGYFTIIGLDFGAGAFDGTARWLGVQVRCPAGSGAYVPLTPRQVLAPAPYALALPGLYTQQNATSPNVIGGYAGNTIDAVVVGGTIAGGGSSLSPNQVTGLHSTVGGGLGNVAGDDGIGGTEGQTATIGGGEGNRAFAGATVGGGVFNKAQGVDSTIAGGLMNQTAPFAAVGGGYNNVASGEYATIPGGLDNLAAGNFSFAGGRRAKANNRGCFVWADYSVENVDLTCDVNNRWVVRAAGGVYFYTDYYMPGVYVPTGGTSWLAVSDRAYKENITPLNGKSVLDKLLTVPINQYKLKTQDASIRHIGPVAQDLWTAFGYGESTTAINMEDATGVAFAAIQGLHAELEERDARIAELEARLGALEKRDGAGFLGGAAVPFLPLGAAAAGVVAVIAAGALLLRRRGGAR